MKVFKANLFPKANSILACVLHIFLPCSFTLAWVDVFIVCIAILDELFTKLIHALCVFGLRGVFSNAGASFWSN
jgi:hypothetical protein